MTEHSDDGTPDHEDAAPTDAAESVQSTVDPTPPPWGDDFNPERAWQTITHLRGREKELEADAKNWGRLREDPDYQRQVLADLGFEVEDADDQDDEDEYLDDDDPVAPIRKELSELQQWKAEQAASQARAEFNQHLDRLAGDAKVDLDDDDRDYLLNRSIKAGFNPQATEAAFTAFVERQKRLEQQAIERYSKSKRSPAAPQSGRSGEQTIDPNATPQQRAAARRERMAATMAAEADEAP